MRQATMSNRWVQAFSSSTDQRHFSHTSGLEHKTGYVYSVYSACVLCTVHVYSTYVQSTVLTWSHGQGWAPAYPAAASPLPQDIACDQPEHREEMMISVKEWISWQTCARLILIWSGLPAFSWISVTTEPMASACDLRASPMQTPSTSRVSYLCQNQL